MAPRLETASQLRRKVQEGLRRAPRLSRQPKKDPQETRTFQASPLHIEYLSTPALNCSKPPHNPKQEEAVDKNEKLKARTTERVWRVNEEGRIRNIGERGKAMHGMSLSEGHAQLTAPWHALEPKRNARARFYII